MYYRSVFGLCVLFVLSGSTGVTLCSVHADDGRAGGAAYALEDLAWMAGDWRSERGGDLLQELWSEPVGDSMMCAFRWMKGGKSWMYELITITREDKGLRMRLKHFSNQMVAWEEKDECLDFSLVRLSDREAVFEHPTRKNARRLIYTRPTDDTMVARVEGIKDDGSTSTLDIKFVRH